jgi:hypothetical protein
MYELTRSTPYSELPEKMTVKEFADYVGLSTAIVYQQIRLGALQCERYSRRGKGIRISKTILLTGVMQEQGEA